MQSNALRTTGGAGEREENERIDVNYGRGNGQKSGDRAEESGTPVVRPPKLHVHQRGDDHDTAEFEGSQ